MLCKSILVVEDDSDIRENLAFALESEGYVVHQVCNGQEALNFLEKVSADNYPGCIILDLMMPVMDGETFLNVIHTDMIEYSKIPVLIATAAGNADFILSLKGAVEKVRKPIDLERLLSMVEKHCGSASKKK